MGQKTGIAWCHHTGNYWRGCEHVSEGCRFCYAEVMAKRNPGVLGEWGAHSKRVVAAEAYWRQPLRWDRAAKEAGERRRVFCMSLADWLEDRPELEEPRQRLLGIVKRTPHLDWLLLTKRPQNWQPLLTRARDVVHAGYAPECPGGAVLAADWLAGESPPNVWLGVTCENRRQGLPRVDLLRQLPARVRFLSCEPLLEGLGDFDLSGIHWLIAGGESGPRRREVDIGWVESLVRHGRSSGVACFVKQDSGLKSGKQGRLSDEVWAVKEFPRVPIARMRDVVRC